MKYKKHILLLLILLMASSAQHIGFSFNVGGNLVTPLTGNWEDLTDSTRPVSGHTIGGVNVIIHRDENGFLGFQTGIFYETKGIEYTSSSLDDSSTQLHGENAYLSIPTLFVLGPAEHWWHVMGNLYTGFTTSFLVNEDINYWSPGTELVPQDFKSPKVDVGYTVGGSVTFFITDYLGIRGEGSYTWGLVPLNRHSSTYPENIRWGTAQGTGSIFLSLSELKWAIKMRRNQEEKLEK